MSFLSGGGCAEGLAFGFSAFEELAVSKGLGAACAASRFGFLGFDPVASC